MSKDALCQEIQFTKTYLKNIFDITPSETVKEVVANLIRKLILQVITFNEFHSQLESEGIHIFFIPCLQLNLLLLKEEAENNAQQLWKELFGERHSQTQTYERITLKTGLKYGPSLPIIPEWSEASTSTSSSTATTSTIIDQSDLPKLFPIKHVSSIEDDHRELRLKDDLGFEYKKFEEKQVTMWKCAKNDCEAVACTMDRWIICTQKHHHSLYPRFMGL